MIATGSGGDVEALVRDGQAGGTLKEAVAESVSVADGGDEGARGIEALDSVEEEVGDEDVLM